VRNKYKQPVATNFKVTTDWQLSANLNTYYRWFCINLLLESEFRNYLFIISTQEHLQEKTTA
jgi:hypothetical protein